MKITYLFTICALLCSSILFAQKVEPTSWQTSVSKKEVKAGEVVELIFTAEIIEGWYLYSSDFDPDLGPVVATFRFTENDSYELVGDITPIGAKSKEDNLIWMGTYTYFKHKAEFRQKVKILKDNPQIKVKLNGQACNDESGRCVPVIQQFSFNGIKLVSAPAVKENPLKGPESAPQKDLKKKENSKTESTAKAKNIKKLNPEDYPSRIEYLKAEKEQLIQLSANGKDLVVEQLEEFVQKYGKN